MRHGSRRTVAKLAHCALLLALPIHGVAYAQEGDVVTGPPPESAEPPPAMTIEVSEPSPPAPESDQARLGTWFDYLAEQDRRERLTSGSSTLIVSSGILAFGIWAFIRTPPTTELNKGIGMLTIAAGGTGMAVGIAQLATKSTSEKRLVRWNESKASGLSLRELGRYEGELRSYSTTITRERVRARWSSFGLALTGGLILGLTPVADLSSDAQTVGYIAGGVALGVGLLGFAVSFRSSYHEEYWNAYQEGQGPPRAGKMWRASPAIGRKFVGAQLAGTF